MKKEIEEKILNEFEELNKNYANDVKDVKSVGYAVRELHCKLDKIIELLEKK
ncbi:MAG: hypothetical protein JW924_08535 [Fusobacteriaceae bacterium]|nr:hypothetical protein [Fusobacteriaceae bacterium]